MKLKVLDVFRKADTYTTFASTTVNDRIVAVLGEPDKEYNVTEIRGIKPSDLIFVGLVRINEEDDNDIDLVVNILSKKFKNKIIEVEDLEELEKPVNKELTFTGYTPGNYKCLTRRRYPTRLLNRIRHKLVGKRRMLNIDDIIG